MPGDPQDVTYNGLNFIIKVNVPENKRKTFVTRLKLSCIFRMPTDRYCPLSGI